MLVLRWLFLAAFLYGFCRWVYQEWMILEDQPRDKKYHVLAGFVIYLVIALVFYRQTISFVPFMWIVLAAVGKEIYDKGIKRERFDTGDIRATIMGGVYSMVLYITFLMVWSWL